MTLAPCPPEAHVVERIGISLEKDLLEQFDRLIAEKRYANRSEVVRDLIRDALVQHESKEGAPVPSRSRS